MKNISLSLLAFMLMTTLAACNISQETDTSVEADTTMETDMEEADAEVSTDAEIELSDEEIAEASAMMEAMAIVYDMEADGMVRIHEMYPDLVSMKTVAAGSSESISGAEEEWMYSESADVTVVASTESNTPVHVFKGQELSADEIAEVKVRMEEMMNAEEADESAAGGTGELEMEVVAETETDTEVEIAEE